jgi:hypothetical protein
VNQRLKREEIVGFSKTAAAPDAGRNSAGDGIGSGSSIFFRRLAHARVLGKQRLEYKQSCHEKNAARASIRPAAIGSPNLL